MNLLEYFVHTTLDYTPDSEKFSDYEWRKILICYHIACKLLWDNQPKDVPYERYNNCCVSISASPWVDILQLKAQQLNITYKDIEIDKEFRL